MCLDFSIRITSILNLSVTLCPWYVSMSFPTEKIRSDKLAPRNLPKYINHQRPFKCAQYIYIYPLRQILKWPMFLLPHKGIYLLRQKLNILFAPITGTICNNQGKIRYVTIKEKIYSKVSQMTSCMQHWFTNLKKIVASSLAKGYDPSTPLKRSRRIVTLC